MDVFSTDTSKPTVTVSSFSSFQLSTNISSANAATNVSTNNTQMDSFFDRDEELAKVEIAILSTILYLTLFGNIFVLVVLRLRRQKLTRMQWFILHLSLADIFVAFFHILPQLVKDITNRFYGDDFVCRSIKYLNVVAMYASSYVLVMAAVDRYVSICHPLTNQTLSPKRIHLMILLAWGLSLLFSLPQIFIFSLQDMGGDGYECYADFSPHWGLKAWVTWVFLSVYAIPFLMLSFCYTRICHVVWISVDSKQSGSHWNNPARTSDGSGRGFLWRISFSKPSGSNVGNTSASFRLNPDEVNGHVSREDAQSLRCLMSNKSKPRGHQRRMTNSKMKTVKMTLTVVLCYFLCWAPFFIVNMLTVWDESVAFEGSVFIIIALLASLNSCTNPWIYLCFSGRSCHPCSRPSDRRISRSWTRSTHVVTASYESENRSRTSMYDLSRCNSREPSPWTRDTLRTNSSC